MRKIVNIVLVIVLSSCFKICNAQHSDPDTINAKFLNEQIFFDGKLNEPCWQTAFKISNFTQRELSFGDPATEKTEVAIVYDKLAMYIGVWCYQRQSKKITAKFMTRDFNYVTDTNLSVLISYLNHKQNH